MDKNFTKIFENVELTEEQVSALDSFFAEYAEKIRETISEDYEQEISQLNEELETIQEQSEEDSDKDSLYSPENVERAFELFKEDTEKAFELYKEDLQQEYAATLTEALQETYESIEGRVKKDIFEGEEMTIISKVKEAVKPLMVDESTGELVKRVKVLEEQLQEKEKINEELSKKEIINTLVEDIPEEFAEEVREVLNRKSTEEEIYRAFEDMLPILEKKFSYSEEDSTDDEDEDDEELDDIVDNDDDDETFEESKKENNKEKEVILEGSAEFNSLKETLLEEGSLKDGGLTVENALQYLTIGAK